MPTMRDRILGCLIGAAYGDALGAPTENRTREQIYGKWGYVNRLIKPPPDVFARGNAAGQVTDDFSMAYVTITTILEHGRIIDPEITKEALIAWSENERFFDQFAGPTSKKFINRLKGVNQEEHTEFEPVNDNRRASNGAAMKIGPISLFARGDMEMAMQITEIICMPTHGNRISLSAAGAVAASVNSALRGNDRYRILQDGIEGARLGEEIGIRSGTPIAGPSVVKRMKTAIAIGEMAQDLSGAMDRLRAVFDCSGMAADSVPVSFGLMAAAPLDGNGVIEAAANIGNDTDTMATIVGAVLGAGGGAEIFSKETAGKIEQVNGYNLKSIAEQIERSKVVVRSGERICKKGKE